MRAARLLAPGKAAVEHAPIPAPAEHEVRFRVEGCGVSGANVGPWLGLPWLKYPLGPGETGHEAWGVVDRVGAHVTHIATGDRVGAVSNHGYAEYDVADAKHVVKLPRDIDGAAFPVEAAGRAFNVLSRSRIRPRDTVAVVGIGFMGAILTKLARLAGARVVALSRRPFALDIARNVGAHEVVALDAYDDARRRVEEWTDGELCDVVVEATGHQGPLDLCAELTKTRGRLVIAGYHQDGHRCVNMQLWNYRGLDVINAHERDPAAHVAGMRDAVDAVAECLLDVRALVTHTYALDELGAALDATHLRPEGFLKAVVVP